MEEVPLRELRNHTSAVLRRVEAGELVVVTVDRRPVAEIVPIRRRPTWVVGEVARAGILRHQADAALTSDLAELFVDTTDDL